MSEDQGASRRSTFSAIPVVFNAAVDVACQHEQEGKLATFNDVIGAERAQIRLRRRRARDPKAPLEGPEERKAKDAANTPPEILHGLALSGGGIRSATFSLGLLQAMNASGALSKFDYLSTVSGGGFAGGWWSAWLSRAWNDGSLFPRKERIALERSQAQVADKDAPNLPDGSRSANEGDAFHHVRLFANYLTPRKGLLSADTWTAGTVVGRNLALTWVVLIPLIVTAMLLAQLFFAINMGERFYGDGALIQEKIRLAASPLLVLLSWIAVLTVLWMVNSVGYWIPAVAGIGVVGVIAWFITHAFGVQTADSNFWSSRWVFFGIAGIVIFTLIFLVPLVRDGLVPHNRRRDARRNFIARTQATLVMALAATALVLVLGGFGHDIGRYLFDSSKTAFHDYVLKTGGILAAVTGIVTSIITAVSASPTGGGETAKDKGAGIMKLAFMLAPPLLLAVLGVSTAAAMHSLVSSSTPATLSPIVTATWAGIALLLALAAYETLRDEMELPRWRRATIVGVPVGIAAITMWMLPPNTLMSRGLMLATIVAAACAIAGRWTVARVFSIASDRFPILKEVGWPGAVAIVVVAVLAGAVAWSVALGLLDTDAPAQITRAFLATTAFCVAFAVAEAIWLKDERRRAAGLVAIAFVGVVSVAVPGALSASEPGTSLPYASIIFAVAVVSLSTVVGFGWLADPNQLSLHTFYRARLVRAYLGASNKERHGHEITESHPNDDVALHALANCERGAPYHIVNTTLNMVGGRDLATAQRYADNFIMSAKYCGSSATGYRPTNEYMSGTLSLGTAVAVSGAAVSPTMGSKTPSAALAMLLTLFNVRLGYWAPTPNRGRYRSRQARLWPFYTLRELLSQTNALASYCYLTDGGHFDNSGVHALVERGCRVIVVSDCGADPGPAFEDMGTAIRRCRIDFGADIQLEHEKFLRKDGLSETHYVQGTIVYSKEHAEKLGWGADLHEGRRTGVILWIKPARKGDERLDIVHYGLANRVFPQQSTADQWYDEAQFESYRQLGYDSGTTALNDAHLHATIAALVP